MLDRFLKLIVAGTLALLLILTTIRVLAQVLEASFRNLLTALGAAGGLLAVVVLLGFLFGLLIRTTQFIANRDPRAARERATRDRNVRQRVRRPAEGVPPVNRAEVPDDPDPAIGDEDQE